MTKLKVNIHHAAKLDKYQLIYSMEYGTSYRIYEINNPEPIN
jgi:hypothetical protein